MNSEVQLLTQFPLRDSPLKENTLLVNSKGKKTPSFRSLVSEGAIYGDERVLYALLQYFSRNQVSKKKKKAYAVK